MLRHVQPRPLLTSLAAALLVFGTVWGIRELGLLQTAELYAYDAYLAAANASKSGQPRVTLVELTEDDIRYLGRWPMSDEQLAAALERLFAAGPRVVGVDIYRDVPVPPGTDRLTALLTSRDDLVAVTKYPDPSGRGVPPPPALRGTSKIGFNDVVTDVDGTVRRALVFVDDGNEVELSFALRLALAYLAPHGIGMTTDPSQPDIMKLGATTIAPLESHDGGFVDADTAGYQFLMDYAAPPFERVRLRDVMTGGVPPERLRNRIVILGVAAISVKDEFRIPHYQPGAGDDGTIAGIALHGHIADQLVRAALDGDRPLGTWSDGSEYAWILSWCLLGALAGLWVHSARRLLLISIAGVALILALAFVAFMTRLWIPTVPALAGWLVALAAVTGYRVHAERLERTTLMHLFSKHVSPEVAETIWAHRAELIEGGRLSGRQLTATVMFLDLAGFTGASETLTPHALMDWLRVATETMSRVVMRHSGVIDDYFGDGIKANFGVPFERRSESEIDADALNAVRCALEMRAALDSLNASWTRHGAPTARLRIGIATGPVVAGSVGSTERMKYTTVGDTVNVAARLEAFDREGFAAMNANEPCRILVSAETHRRVAPFVQAESLGAVSLKGKEQDVIVFRILGAAESAEEAHT
ncbi:MAG TPA: adenylate/guanylate cyclase domain-containing protein [Steroidobacteraceae bacterium]|nr:adenylate/guanylate cyclase domain-containing protein [Steroidobacteraceae bacterium]